MVTIWDSGGAPFGIILMPVAYRLSVRNEKKKSNVGSSVSRPKLHGPSFMSPAHEITKLRPPWAIKLYLVVLRHLHSYTVNGSTLERHFSGCGLKFEVRAVNPDHFR